jgi:integrator complex subunit 6
MSLFSQVVEKYPFTHFMRALKSVQARDLTNIGGALQRIFAFLHVQRLTLDIDRYGQGRNPCVNDLTTILLLTDGTELTSLAGVSQILLSNGPLPLGADLAVQPFRWDQRVFATVLRIPSVSAAVLERSGPIPQNAPISGAQSAVVMDTNISAFCDVTGGKCFVATSWKILMQHTEVMAARLPPCVIVSFEHMSLPGFASLPPQVSFFYLSFHI